MTSWWRPLAFALAAAALSNTSAAQDMPIAERIKLCSACHGEDGNSTMPNTPSLAGQPEFYLTNQLFLFREGVRKIPGMSELLKGLKDDDLVALAGHFAKLEPKASDEKIDPALVKRGEAMMEPMRCASCRLPASPGRTRCRDWRSSGSTI